jgi:predicted dehydrogenase
MVGFNYRRVPALVMARDLLAEGRLGTFRHVRVDYMQDWLVDPGFPVTWRLLASEAGSGALGDLGTHAIDIVRFLTGEEVAEVCGAVATFVDERPAGFAAGSGQGLGAGRGRVTVDDAFLALGRLEGGALVSLEASRMVPGRKNALNVEISGSEGTIRFELERLNHLWVYDARRKEKGFVERLVTEPTDPYIAQWWPPGHVLGWEHTFVHEFQDLMDALAGQRQPDPSFGDGFLVQAVTEAIARSARAKSWVRVAEVLAEDGIGTMEGVAAASVLASGQGTRAGDGR